MQVGSIKTILLFCYLTIASLSVYAQSGNPFELQPRLSTEEQTNTESSEAVAPVQNENANPFDLSDRLPASETEGATTDSTPTGNPFDITAPTPIEVSPPSESFIQQSPEPEAKPTLEASAPNAGIVLTIIVGLLLIITISLLFFREVYANIYRALFNDNLLSQLYREREAGNFGIFLITYLIFFLSGGVFLSLALDHYEYSIAPGMMTQVLYCTLGLMAIFLGKHLLLAIIGFIFPLRKEIGRYSFMIMAFSIILSLVFVIGSVGLAYAPTEWQNMILLGVIGIVGLAYVWRTIRGLFQANHLFFGYPFHFLSYICAIEIGPVIVLLKLITTN